MQAGEPLASDGPTVMAMARMGVMRTVIAITPLKKRSPGRGRGQLARFPAVLFRGQTTGV
jgi:hypothetical protein